jgi:hypothetical protein
VIDVTEIRILDLENKKSECEYRIYKNGVLEIEFKSKYFELLFFKPLDETMEDLEKALVRVNEDPKEGSEIESITKFNILRRLARKYHQGWSWFFSEEEYVNNWYEDNVDEDEGAMVTKLNKLHSNFKLGVHFNLAVQDENVDGSRKKYLDSANSKKKKKFRVDGKSLTETVIVMIDPNNKFMTTRYKITIIIAGRDESSLCKKLIKKVVQSEVNLPYTHRFHKDCLFMYMTEIQACPVCHIYITLDLGKIVNKYSRNFPNRTRVL